jgi:hypothetical protein
MIEVAARLILAGVLAAAAGAKLARPRASSAAMATYGFRRPAGQWIAWGFAVLAESGLAVGVAAGSDAAAYGAAALMLLFAATLGSALLEGKAGAPCACFGPRSTVHPLAVARNLGLAAAFAVLPALPAGSPTTDEWLALGLAVALLACAGLTIALLALAREVGMLRLRLGPSSALEVSHEGPELGGRVALIERFRLDRRTELAVAVFTSVGCHVCRALAPAVDSLRSEPSLAVLSFEESADSDAWESLAIPGAPYALAIEPDGTVTAKGTFNNLAQLESIIATAERRRAERRRVEATLGA